MKIYFFGIALFAICNTFAQDSLLIKKDNKAIGDKVVKELRIDTRAIKQIEAEMFYVLIRVKDSVFNSLEVFARNNAILTNLVDSGLTKLLTGFRFASCSTGEFILPLVYINLARYNNKYDYMKKFDPSCFHPGSKYLCGVVFSVNTNYKSKL